MLQNGEDTKLFIPASREFRVVAIGTPVRELVSFAPPLGLPLSPPKYERVELLLLTGKSVTTLSHAYTDFSSPRHRSSLPRLPSRPTLPFALPSSLPRPSIHGQDPRHSTWRQTPSGSQWQGDGREDRRGYCAGAGWEGAE